MNKLLIPTQQCGVLLHQIESSLDSIPEQLILGFHGYGESAQIHMQRLLDLEPNKHRIACPQALHAFYNKHGEVGHSWMTSEDRDLQIENNLAYMDHCISQLEAMAPIKKIWVLGFSQGVAMALRFGLRHPKVSGIACLGGDFPEDCIPLLPGPQSLLWGRGEQDRLMPADKWEKSAELLQEKTPCQILRLPGNHFCWQEKEWTRACKNMIES